MQMASFDWITAATLSPASWLPQERCKPGHHRKRCGSWPAMQMASLDWMTAATLSPASWHPQERCKPGHESIVVGTGLPAMQMVSFERMTAATLSPASWLPQERCKPGHHRKRCGSWLASEACNAGVAGKLIQKKYLHISASNITVTRPLYWVPGWVTISLIGSPLTSKRR